MCGIVGFLNIKTESRSAVPRHELELATDRLRSRGPDDGHVWVSDNNRVGFGHRRLSVIDVTARGRQPMRDEADNCLVFNGEIYNFKDLKKRFQRESFASETDTEVLLKGLSQTNFKFISELDGMFAFAFYNKRENKVLLATDPAGKKPVYTYWDGQIFIFASELKAILAFQGCDFSIDRQKVQQSLVFGYVPYPHTIYCKIRKLPAGHFQEVDLERDLGDPGQARLVRRPWILVEVAAEAIRDVIVREPLLGDLRVPVIEASSFGLELEQEGLIGVEILGRRINHASSLRGRGPRCGRHLFDRPDRKGTPESRWRPDGPCGPASTGLPQPREATRTRMRGRAGHGHPRRVSSPPLRYAFRTASRNANRSPAANWSQSR